MYVYIFYELCLPVYYIFETFYANWREMTSNSFYSGHRQIIYYEVKDGDWGKHNRNTFYGFSSKASIFRPPPPTQISEGAVNKSASMLGLEEIKSKHFLTSSRNFSNVK